MSCCAVLCHVVLTLACYAGFINERREFPRMTFAFCVDGIATSVGALMGTSPVTAFIESASGIREGGRTGLTACVVGCYMFIALFFTPLLGRDCDLLGDSALHLSQPDLFSARAACCLLPRWLAGCWSVCVCVQAFLGRRLFPRPRIPLQSCWLVVTTLLCGLPSCD